MSNATSARDGFALMVNSFKDGGDGGKQFELGLQKFMDSFFQMTVFRLMNPAVVAYIIGQALGDDEDEEITIQRDVANFISNDIPFFEMRYQTALMDDNKFLDRFLVQTSTDFAMLVPGLGAFAQTSTGSNIIGGVAQEIGEVQFGVQPKPSDSLVGSEVTDVLAYGGLAGMSAGIYYQYLRSYAGAQRDYDLGVDDLMYGIATLGGNRDSRTYWSERVNNRNETAVFMSQLKRPEEGQTLDQRLDSLMSMGGTPKGVRLGLTTQNVRKAKEDEARRRLYE